MLNTKLYDYLKTMSVYEMNRFHKYIQSPLYNEDEKVKRFVAAILSFAKTNSLEKFKYKLPLPAVKYNRLLSDTVKKLEHFLILDRFQHQQLTQHTYLLEIMNERKLSKHFSEFAALTHKRQLSSPLRDADFYYRGFVIEQQKNLYLETKEARNSDKNILEVLEALDKFYLVQKLKYAAAWLHYKNFLSAEGEINLFKDVITEVNREKYNEVSAIQLYKNIVLLFHHNNAGTAYKTLKKLITGNLLLVSKEETKTALAFAINYCINCINRGNMQFLNELLSLYKFSLLNDLLLEEGVLSQWDYKNITTVALRVKDYKWTENFLEEYKNALPKTERKNAYTFNLARYYFYIKKYDHVLRLLQQVEYSDIFYQLDAKTTLLKTYYELGEWQPLLSLKDSFRILLRRKKLITPSQKENYMNLLRFTIRLFNCDVKNKKQMTDLKRDITTAVNVADKSWLMEKLDEIQS